MKYIHIEIVEAEPEIANHSTEKIKEGEEGMLVTCKSGYKHFVPKRCVIVVTYRSSQIPS